MLEEILTKILLGISLAAPIGPVNAEMIKRGLATGFWGAFQIRLGGSIANLLMLLLAYFGLGKMIQYPRIMFTISIIGVIVLIYLGFKNLIKAFNHAAFDNIINSNGSKKSELNQHGLIVGFGLAIASPIGLMFWLSTFAASMQNNFQNSIYKLLINLFIIVGVLLWGAFISLILHYFKKYINKTLLQWITAISGIILIYFGFKYGVISINNIK